MEKINDIEFLSAQTCQKSGVYEFTFTKERVTVVKGEPFPPIKNKLDKFICVRATR